jgi:hypothetical protein
MEPVFALLPFNPADADGQTEPFLWPWRECEKRGIKIPSISAGILLVSWDK